MIDGATPLDSISCLGMACPCVAICAAMGQVEATIVRPAADVDWFCSTIAHVLAISPPRTEGTVHCGFRYVPPPSLVPT
jgi:hypothetical protein